jgi:hypothetical protein
MDSGAMMYIPSYIKFVSAIHKLIREIRRHRQHGDGISLLSFFLNKEKRLNIHLLYFMLRMV